MTAQKYYGLMTDYGLSKLREATEGIGAVMLSHMAFGDGKGAEIAPTTKTAALVNERYRAPISNKYPHPTNPSILYVEAIIPPGVGGWTLREAGIYDSDGGLVVIAKTPVMDVALLAEGATTEGLVRLPIVFESAQDVEFLIDPTVLLATQAWVIDRIIHRPFITIDSITQTAPPAKPADHALYVVPPAAKGAWLGKDNQMAYWHGAWQFTQAPIAKIVGASDSGKYYKYTATGWVEFVGSETAPGFLQLATDAEHKAGVRRDRATHPAGVATSAQSGVWTFVVAGGTANALTVKLTPAPEALARGMVIQVEIAANNTGPTTINVNELGALPVLRSDGGAVEIGDLTVGQIVSLVCTGAAWQVVGLKSSQMPPRRQQIYNAAGTYSFVVPDGVTKIFGRVCAGGGGAGGIGKLADGNGAPGGAGGAGGYAEGWIDVTPGQVIPIVVGAGGVGGAVSANTPGARGTDGARGGASSIGPFMSATGGEQGYAVMQYAGGGGGNGMGGSINMRGGAGGDGGGAAGTWLYGGMGGASVFGGGGRAATQHTSIVDGFAPGSGGASVYTAWRLDGQGGQGADGMVVLQW